MKTKLHDDSQAGWAPRSALRLIALASALALAPACDDDEKQPTVDAGRGGAGGAVDAGGGAGGAGGAGGTGGAPDGGGDVAASGGSPGTDAGPDVTGDAIASDAGDAAPPPPADTDLALVRFTSAGMVDTTFGTNGIVRLDLGTGAGSTRDSLWGLTRDPQDRLLLFGSKKADGRMDSDRVVVRLTAAGAKDTTFAAMGVHTLDVMNLGDNPRHGFVQADGKILASGYTAQPTGAGAQVANKVVLLRLLETGAPDTAFGTNGIVNSLPFMPADPVNTMWGMAEAYGATLQGDKYVTTGYGRSAAMGPVDMVSFRYTAAGALDTTWGANGIVTLDLIGDNDRGRNILTLPDNRILVVGTASKAAMTEDALVAILSANGVLDPSFDGEGHKLYEFGGTDEEFYGLALSPAKNWVAATGYRAGAGQDDDATLLLLPVGTPSPGAEIAKAVPLSETGNDRLWAVTFDAGGKAVATGFVNEGGDNHMVVVRFNADGTLDPTFGTAGMTKVNVSAGKTDEAARGIVVQADGKIVIAGVAEHL